MTICKNPTFQVEYVFLEPRAMKEISPDKKYPRIARQPGIIYFYELVAYTKISSFTETGYEEIRDYVNSGIFEAKTGWRLEKIDEHRSVWHEPHTFISPEYSWIKSYSRRQLEMDYDVKLS